MNIDIFSSSLLLQVVKVTLMYWFVTLDATGPALAGRVFDRGTFDEPIAFTIYPDTVTEGGLFFFETGSHWYRVNAVVFAGDTFPITYDEHRVDPYWLIPVALGTKSGFHQISVSIDDTIHTDSVFIRKGVYAVWPKAKEIRKKTAAEFESSRKSDSVAEYMYDFDPEFRRLWTLPFIHPTSHLRVKDTYGTLRQMYSNAKHRYHYGIDYAAKVRGVKGDTIRTQNYGIVKRVGYDKNIYGNYIVVDHGGGLFTSYFHAQSIVVAEGDTVERGQLIAYMGMTGNATGPTVHLGMKLHGISINPTVMMEMYDQYFHDNTNKEAINLSDQ